MKVNLIGIGEVDQGHHVNLSVPQTDLQNVYLLLFSAASPQPERQNQPFGGADVLLWV